MKSKTKTVNKRKLHDTTSDEDKHSRTPSSNSQAESNASSDPNNKKLKPFIGLKPTKIQLKLSSSPSSAAASVCFVKLLTLLSMFFVCVCEH